MKSKAADKLLLKVLGKTADLAGDRLHDYAEIGFKNIERIVKRAAKMLKGKLKKRGSVPPKVVKGILNEGYFCEDNLESHYLSGVLASSRSKDLTDDRGAYFISLISRLSSYQVHSHYLLYAATKSVHNGSDVNVFNHSEVESKLQCYVLFDDFQKSLGISDQRKLKEIFPHILHGLLREGLIDRQFAGGSPESLQRVAKVAVSRPGFIFTPTSFGIEFFLWANARREVMVRDFYSRLVDDFPEVPKVRYLVTPIKVKA